MRMAETSLVVLFLVLSTCVGCAHSKNDLAGDPALVPAIRHEATRRSSGRVRVVMGEDLRVSTEKSHHNLVDHYVTDSGLRQPAGVALPVVFAREMDRSGLFAGATAGEAPEATYRLELVAHQFEGTWPGGAWNVFVPWSEVRVTGAVDIEVKFWGKDATGAMKDLLFYDRYKRESSRLVGAWDDGYRAAAEELGKALHLVIGEFLVNLEKEMPEFGLPEGN